MSARDPLPVGLVYGMDNEAYHALDALGSSGRKLLRRTPAHYFGQVLDPNRPQREPSPASARRSRRHHWRLQPVAAI
jgi:hypothetical protein